MSKEKLQKYYQDNIIGTETGIYISLKDYLKIATQDIFFGDPENEDLQKVLEKEVEYQKENLKEIEKEKELMEAYKKDEKNFVILIEKEGENEIIKLVNKKGEEIILKEEEIYNEKLKSEEIEKKKREEIKEKEKEYKEQKEDFKIKKTEKGEWVLENIKTKEEIKIETEEGKQNKAFSNDFIKEFEKYKNENKKEEEKNKESLFTKMKEGKYGTKIKNLSVKDFKEMKFIDSVDEKGQKVVSIIVEGKTVPIYYISRHDKKPIIYDKNISTNLMKTLNYIKLQKENESLNIRERTQNNYNLKEKEEVLEKLYSNIASIPPEGENEALKTAKKDIKEANKKKHSNVLAYKYQKMKTKVKTVTDDMLRKLDERKKAKTKEVKNTLKEKVLKIKHTTELIQNLKVNLKAKYGLLKNAPKVYDNNLNEHKSNLSNGQAPVAPNKK